MHTFQKKYRLLRFYLLYIFSQLLLKHANEPVHIRVQQIERINVLVVCNTITYGEITEKSNAWEMNLYLNLVDKYWHFANIAITVDSDKEIIDFASRPYNDYYTTGIVPLYWIKSLLLHTIFYSNIVLQFLVPLNYDNQK